MSLHFSVIVIGGGAAGFFGAIACSQRNPALSILILEKTNKLLSKVAISGGGRCNVTHACFEPSLLVKNYPRGEKELLASFHSFQPKDTIDWFAQRGVFLKVEEDGRMFPITDSSQTIIDCFLKEAERFKIEIKKESFVTEINKEGSRFHLRLSNGSEYYSEKLLIASGSNAQTYKLLESLGHTIVPPVPSLFTFNVPDSPLNELAGISVVDVNLRIAENRLLEQRGPLLITHWGFSGPSVLKLSAWGARWLHQKGYQAQLWINWLPKYLSDQLLTFLQQCKMDLKARLMASHSPFPEIPRNLWKKLLLKISLSENLQWAQLNKQQMGILCQELQKSSFIISGKTIYKEEFVTCGGILLKEVNFKTMESRIIPGLYFAGEVLDVDGVTGGFNFQNSWTSSWIAARAITGSK